MFNFFKQTFIGLLSFSGSLVAKCISFNNKPYLAKPTLIDPSVRICVEQKM